MRAVIVGAGFGGLSAACHLAGRGHDVTVVERSDRPGGRAGRWDSEGFRFDTGPTVLTMVDLLADTLAAAGVDLPDVLDVRPLEPLYRATFADGGPIEVHRDRDAMVAEIARTCGGDDAAAFDGFAAWLGELYRIELPTVLARNLDSPFDLVSSIASLRAMTRLVRLGGLRRLSTVVERRFHDPRLRRLFTFQAAYAGLSPLEALAVMGVITYMDTVAGVSFPVGGISAIGDALALAAEKAGAELRFDCPVQQITRQPSGAVRGVRLATGEHVDADVVVANPDLPAVYRDLLELPVPRRARRGRYSPSCTLLLAGVRGAPPAESATHNIHFGRAWGEAFDDLIDVGRRMRDPSVLVTVASRSDPEAAPPGCSTLFALEPTPNLDGAVPWRTESGRARQDTLDRLDALGYPTDIVTERFVDPLDWQAMGHERGTPFSLAHTFFQSGPFRPANIDAAVPGLVLVGSGTVPGVGIPMVLLSGRLAADRAESMAGSGRTPR